MPESENSDSKEPNIEFESMIEFNGTIESEEDANTRQQALEKLQADIGTWDCRWEFLDDSGEVVSMANGTQTMNFVIPGSVMQVMLDVPDMETQSATHRFYDPLRKSLFWISVDNKGDYWHFVEKLDGSPSQSLPHPNPDGTTTHLRFTVLREIPNEVDIVMEASEDNENWNAIFRQYRVRR